MRIHDTSDANSDVSLSSSIPAHIRPHSCPGTTKSAIKPTNHIVPATASRREPPAPSVVTITPTITANPVSESTTATNLVNP